MNILDLEMLWANLRGIVSEQAKAMQRLAFSVVVREAGDLAYGVFDTQGNLIAQAETGTPGHLNCLESCGRYLINRYRDELVPGDVLITNDPWLSAGHYFDFTVLAPVYRNGRVIAYLGSTNHHVDIGGRGMGAAARDIYEEGLAIPPCKLIEAGKPNELLYDIIRSNVRLPETVLGDLAAQLTCVGNGNAINEMCDRYGLDHLDELATEILSRSERAMREAIRQCPRGTWEAATEFEALTNLSVRLQLKLAIDHEIGEVSLDFKGSSPQLQAGINVVENYARAYAVFTIKSCLAPDVPNNSGSMRPIQFSAPLGCVINCQHPAPVAARHVVGMHIPLPILDALHQVVPDRVLASSGGCPAGLIVMGVDSSGHRFFAPFSAAGGMGARSAKDGPSATNYPTGVSATSVEVLESEAPLLFFRRELKRGSGGRGSHQGGDGQIVEFKVKSGAPWTLNPMSSLAPEAPAGLAGGEPGAPGRFMINDNDVEPSWQQAMQSDDRVRLETTGGGGYGTPEQYSVDDQQ